MKGLRFLVILLLVCRIVTPTGITQALENATNARDKMVALTFDDGPHPAHTDLILNILEKYNVKATFFVIGQNAESYPEPLKRAYREGHEIENHSYDHKTKGKSAIELTESIQKTSRIIQELTGASPLFFRPPCGKNTEAVKAAVSELSLSPVFWTIDAEDWTGKTAETMARDILREAKGHEVILLHDYTCPGHHTMHALPAIIEGLLEKGYRFVTIAEYFDKIERK